MRWTALATAAVVLSLFGGSVYALKQFLDSDMSAKRSPGQQWDVAGEPTADLKRRARLGEMEAEYQLGLWHRQANRSVDDKQAVEWFKRAADKGHVDSQFYLALHYSDGRGVLQDYTEAARIITALASKNHPDAQAQLGNMYRRGLGLEMDKPRAYLWYNIAASNGSREAAPLRDILASQLSTVELSEAQRQARVLEQTLRAGKDLGPFRPVLPNAEPAKAGAAAAPAVAPAAAAAATPPAATTPAPAASAAAATLPTKQ